MAKPILFILLICFSLHSAQEVKQLFDDENFDALIKKESEISSLKAQEIYYVGYAFFRKEDDANAIKFYDIAIEKGFKNPIVYFQKGLSQVFLEKYEEGIGNFNIAISQVPKAEFYIEKGRAYRLQNNLEKEISTYLEGLENAEKDNFYIDLIKVAGNYYYSETKEYEKSVEVYKNGIALFPQEYQLYEKIIKALNAKNKFSDAAMYFEKMKTFYNEKSLPEDMMKFKNLPIDEFEWNGQYLNVFKSFEKPKDLLDVFYVVYLIDKSGKKIERKFNVEKTIQVNKSDPAYVICEELKNGHNTYPIGFKDENFTVQDLRNIITEILNKKHKISGSIEFGK